MEYLSAITAAISRLCNALIGGNPSETLSSRAHRHGGWGEKIINTLFFFQEDHCLTAYDYDRRTARELKWNTE
jgi:hypothetical protein